MSEAEQAFTTYLTQRDVEVESMTALEAVDLMTSWYETQRAEDVSVHSGDMLLFQWGTYDWGDGPSFRYDITRQFIGHGQEDDDIWQLSLTVHADPTDEAKAVGAGNRWCDGLSDLGEMRKFIARSPATEHMGSVAVFRAELRYECAG